MIFCIYNITTIDNKKYEKKGLYGALRHIFLQISTEVIKISYRGSNQ